MMNYYIKSLLTYGLTNELIQKEDLIYTRNQLLSLFQLDEYEDVLLDKKLDLEDILNGMVDYAFENGIISDNGIVTRDLFDTKIMGLLIDRPSNIVSKFLSLYKEDPQSATNYYYKLSMDSDYIRRYRIKKDMKWVTSTKYGDLDITINLSKPEKDPKAIAAAKLLKQSGYPSCLLCKENEGYAGRVNHPARQNHRIIPIEINNTPWGFQYSPYVYYNEHCIVFSQSHTPMKIDGDTFRKLFDFVKLFPHYFVGSNADLPIVGGSILTHDHFQGGNYEFAMAKADSLKGFTIKGYEDITVGVLNWPMTVLRLSGKDSSRLVELGEHILTSWRGYTDESSFVYAFSDKLDNLLSSEQVRAMDTSELEAHNTITPIARKKGEFFELDLVLRNNVTTSEHPFGVYHPHAELHHIKKENIGLIEVMGLAVLPARLKDEMAILKDYIVNKKDITSNEEISKHAEWVATFSKSYDTIDSSNIDTIIEEEIGKVFAKVLEHAGVYKLDEVGMLGIERFIETL